MLGRSYLMVALGIFCSTQSLASSGDIVASNNQFSMQLLTTRVDYTETGTGVFSTPTGVLDTENGTLQGLALGYSQMNPGDSHEYFAVGLDYVSGFTNYVGMPISGGAYGSATARSTAALSNENIRFGRGLEFRHGLMLTPYVEIGQHSWDRGINYGEKYSNMYFGFGGLGQYAPMKRLVVSLKAMAGETFMSHIVAGGPPGFSGDLGNSLIYTLGVSVDYALTKNFHTNLGIDYTKFSYGMSEIVVSNDKASWVWEPDSATFYTTMKLGVGYAF